MVVKKLIIMRGIPGAGLFNFLNYLYIKDILWFIKENVRYV